VEILSLTTEGFRTLLNGKVEVHPRLNLIVGDNGQGKTNLLEALALVSGRPSFRTRELAEARQHLAARAVVSARLRDDTGTRDTTRTLGFVYAGGVREQYRDGKRVTRLAAARGLPAVFLTARDLSRLSGPPAERRRALDRAALALRPEHARALLAYERARAAKTASSPSARASMRMSLPYTKPRSPRPAGSSRPFGARPGPASKRRSPGTRKTSARRFATFPWSS